MRRHIPEEPISAYAAWSNRLAGFALLVGALSVALARARIVEPPSAVAVLGSAIVLALFALLLFGGACLDIWRTGRGGTGLAALALLMAATLLAYPAYLAAEAVRLPVLSDISTDVANPPDFSMSGAADKARGGYLPAPFPEDARVRQATAYPDIEPIIVDLDADEAFPLVLKAAQARGWRLVDQRPPGGRMGLGHADFLDHTLVMGFDEDIAVRVRPLPGQTRIDVRASSRYGRHDFGANARRIAAFAEEIQSQVDAR